MQNLERLQSLPELIILQNGEPLTGRESWERQRRPQLLDLFREHVYGREPVQRPETLRFSVEAMHRMMDGAAFRKQVRISYEGPGGQGSFMLNLFVPIQAEKPVPAFLLINNRGLNAADPERLVKHSFWPAERIVARGYAAAVLQLSEIDPDQHDDFRNGVHGIFDPPERKRPPNAWGTIAAWAWGACRAMDYLETDTDIDSARVAVVGHSRGGKTALWAGAIDRRFAMVVSNNSGCTGAAVTRGKKGETVRDINKSFPHWFNENYKSYNGKEELLPVDQHMLLALIAPRLLYVSSATDDEWADPASEFLSVVLAAPAYHFYAVKGIDCDRFPEPDTPVHGDRIGYHLRTGKHDMVDYDWEQFMDFADERMK